MPKLSIGAMLDPATVTVCVRRDDSGNVAEAFLDLHGVPRIDNLLTGRRVEDAVDMVTHICGICPATHHLAGMAALDQLYKAAEVPPAAQATRLLLYYGSVIEALAPRFLCDDDAAARTLVQFARTVLKAAGQKGHFPQVAVPGGVVQPAEHSSELVEQAAAAQAAAERIVNAQAAGEPEPFDGVDIVLTDRAGTPCPLGGWARVGETVIPAEELAQAIVEDVPGAIRPRPRIHWQGADIYYRTGPCAHFPAEPPRRAQALFLRAAVEAVAQFAIPTGEVCAEAADHAAPGTGMGMVDGPRGLLIHTYHVDEDGMVAAAQILSPTAQNEPWMSSMLTSAVQEGEDTRRMEEIIRTADPCLPCTLAPVGTMHIELHDVEEG